MLRADVLGAPAGHIHQRKEPSSELHLMHPYSFLPAHSARPFPSAFRIVVIAMVWSLGGCAFTPEGADKERARLDAAGESYHVKFAERSLPEFPESPKWRDVLQRAFLTNGDLEATYFAWRAAYERIDVAAAYPNSDVSLGYSYMFSSERMKTFDRMTFGAGFDGSENLAFPSKAKQAGRVALDEARAAGERFQARKFDLQKKVLFAWADYVQRGVAIRAMSRDLELLRVATTAAAIAQSSGGAAERALSAQIQAERLVGTLADMRAEQEAMKAEINGLIARDPKAPLNPPEIPDTPRKVPVEDDELIRISADMFPEVAALAHELQGRKDALELARLRWIPDINPNFSVTGTISRAIGAAITLPTSIAEIRGNIRAAEADMQSAEATLRQRKAERVSEYIGLIVALRRAEARTAWLESTLRPATARLAALREQGYETGAGSLVDVIEARRVLIEIDIAVAQSRAQVEKSIVDIECCLGLDIETLKPTVQGPAPAGTAQEGPAPG